ncbi:MAG: hypothetical protein ACTSU5_16430 [Promethearchaeota archaeon]
MDPDEGPKLFASFFEAEQVEVTKDLLLRIQMGHSVKQLNSLITEDVVFVSYLVEDRKSAYILGLFLETSDKPESFSQNLKKAALMIKGDVGGSASDLNAKLEELYFKHFRTPQVVLDSKEIEQHIKDKTKELLKQGKTKEAQELLEKVQKRKLPKKLYNCSEKAQKAISSKDFDKAVKLYEEAAGYASELDEPNLARVLLDRAKITRKIPGLLEERNRVASDARKSLREENFHRAAVLYKKAADLSNELMDPASTEEYTLKAKALADFAKIDKKFKK